MIIDLSKLKIFTNDKLDMGQTIQYPISNICFGEDLKTLLEKEK